MFFNSEAFAAPVYLAFALSCSAVVELRRAAVFIACGNMKKYAGKGRKRYLSAKKQASLIERIRLDFLLPSVKIENREHFMRFRGRYLASLGFSSVCALAAFVLLFVNRGASAILALAAGAINFAVCVVLRLTVYKKGFNAPPKL